MKNWGRKTVFQKWEGETAVLARILTSGKDYAFEGADTQCQPYMHAYTFILNAWGQNERNHFNASSKPIEFKSGLNNSQKNTFTNWVFTKIPNKLIKYK